MSQRLKNGTATPRPILRGTSLLSSRIPHVALSARSTSSMRPRRLGGLPSWATSSSLAPTPPFTPQAVLAPSRSLTMLFSSPPPGTVLDCTLPCHATTTQSQPRLSRHCLTLVPSQFADSWLVTTTHTWSPTPLPWGSSTMARLVIGPVVCTRSSLPTLPLASSASSRLPLPRVPLETGRKTSPMGPTESRTSL